MINKTYLIGAVIACIVILIFGFEHMLLTVFSSDATAENWIIGNGSFFAIIGIGYLLKKYGKVEDNEEKY